MPLTCSQPGSWPATKTCALTRNQTGDLLLCGLMPNQLSHNGQGQKKLLKQDTKLLIIKKMTDEVNYPYIKVKNFGSSTDTI